MLSGNRKRLKKDKLFGRALMTLCVSLLVMVFPVAPPLSSAETTEEPIQLEAGSSVRREIAPGARDLFGVAAQQGEVLLLSLHKGDLTVSVALYGPNGTKVLEHFSQDFEELEISFPVADTGAHRIEIQLQDNGATRRNYELKLHSSKSIATKDRKHWEAQRAFAEAEVLRATWTKDSLRQSIDSFGSAARRWTEIKEFARASRSILKSGDVCFLLSEYQRAFDRYQNALVLARKAGDAVAQARALTQLGHLSSYRGDNDSAQQHLNRALDLLGPVADGPDATARNAFGAAVSILAEVLYANGNLDRSMAQFERARKILHEDRKGRAKTHLFSGYIAGSLGSSDKAVAEISRALELFREIRNKSGEGLALTALGLFNSFLKNDDQAIQLHRTAIDIFRAIGDRSSEGIGLNALGQSYESRKEYAVALEHYQQALRLFQDQGVLDFASVTLFKVARAFQLMGKLDQALDYHERCLQASRAARKQRTEVNALIEMAGLFAAQNRPEQALRQYQKIGKFYESIGDRRGQAIALNTHGDFLFDLGKKQQALDSYNRSLPLSEEVGDKDILIATLYSLARAHRDLGSYDVALSYIKRSIEIIEDLRTNVGSPDVRASYFSGVRTHYELNINILMQLHRVRPGESFAADALLLSEKSRARLLIDLLRESAVDLRAGASQDLLERERTLRGLLQSLARYQHDLSLRVQDATEIADVASRMAQLRAEYQEIQSQLRQQNPHLLALESTTPPSLTQIQNELRDSDTVVLEYALGDEQSYLWAITSNSLHGYELPSRKVLEEAVKEVYALITARQGSDGATDRDYQAKLETADQLYLEKTGSLSQMLLGPVAEQLGTKRLVVVAEGALQYLAFDALPEPRAPSQSLIDMHEIVVLPSISTLIAIRNSQKSPSSAGKVVAVFADPVFSRSDDRVQTKRSDAIAQVPSEEATSKASEGVLRGAGLARLIHAAEEADAISASAPRGTVMVAKGFEASRDAALSLPVSQYKILHFATHAFVDNEHPELSGIALAMLDSNGVEKNGLVPLHDIYSLDLSAELTVLSACQTALGKDIKGEGLVGLTHSFMSAGSKSVVASLWKVDDRATSILMKEFYRSMLEDGMTPAAALRSAKLKMIKDGRWSAPYYWAGFVLQGEYTNRISIESNSWFGFGVVSSLVLIVILSGIFIFQRRWRGGWRKVV